MKPKSSTYRSEIDGLRALAVLSVVAFHAFPTWFPGGFIGVDVFFVISGYLISRHIFDELEKDQFSVKKFWLRRIRRLFPALVLVLISSILFGFFGLLPSELKQLSKHVFSSVLFFQNFSLVGEAGYFDNSSYSKPLLHLWSLSLEEQFYFFWPIVLIIAFRFSIKIKVICLMLTLLSFLLNVLFIKEHPIDIFYLPYGRFWELLIGAFLAWSNLNMSLIHI